MRRRNIRGEETHGKPCAVQYICHACSIGGNADLFLQDPYDLSGQEPLRLSIVIILENIELTTKRKVLKRIIYCQVNIVLFYRFIIIKTRGCQQLSAYRAGGPAGDCVMPISDNTRSR